MRKKVLLPSVNDMLLSLAFVGSGIFSPLVASADTKTPPINIHVKFDNPLGTTRDLPTLLIKVLDVAVELLAPVVTIMLLYSGFLFVAAQGNSEKLTKAKKTLMYSLAGAAIVLGAKGFAIVLQSAIGCLGNAPGC